MRYKDRLIDLTRHFLLKTHTTREVDRMLGQWNNPEYTDERNKVIEDAIAGIKDSVDTTYKE